MGGGGGGGGSANSVEDRGQSAQCQMCVYIQGVSGGIINILGGGSKDYSE